MDFAFTARSPNIIVVDDFYADPDAVRSFALAQEFQHNPASHKGQRSKQRFYSDRHREIFEDLLKIEIRSWHDQPFNGVFQFCIAGDQIVYHSDAQQWAGVVYLTPNAPLGAGTSFYRSKKTGLRLPPTQKDADAAGVSIGLLETQMYRNKLLDGQHWDVVDVVGNIYNRLALWNAKMVHAASSYFGDCKENGRLFHMFFFS